MPAPQPLDRHFPRVTGFQPRVAVWCRTPGSGHSTVHPDGRHLLTDTYAHEDLSFDGGTVPLRPVDLADLRPLLPAA